MDQTKVLSCVKMFLLLEEYNIDQYILLLFVLTYIWRTKYVCLGLVKNPLHDLDYSVGETV